jgi:hypothetical protein
MARIIIEYDTNSKSCSVTQDGKELKDWRQITFACYGEMDGKDIHGMEIQSYKYDEANSMSEHRVVYAAKMKEYASAIEKTQEYLTKKA